MKTKLYEKYDLIYALEEAASYMDAAEFSGDYPDKQKRAYTRAAVLIRRLIEKEDKKQY